MTKVTRALLYCSLLLLVACKKEPINSSSSDSGSGTGTGPGTGTTTAPTDDSHLLLGNPTNAGTASPDNYLIDRIYWTGGYNNSRGTCMWISWHLQASDLGTTSRQDNFRADNGLPSGFYLVQNTSYSSSGFDRGHNTPSADRTATVAANSATFLMTNMIPQAPTFNQGPWANMEDSIRVRIVGSANEAFIIMGAYGQGGVGTASTNVVNTIDNGHVTVPKKVFKVIVYVAKGSDDLNRIDSNAKVLAVNMPNDNRLYTTNSVGQQAWKNYITTISDIEADAANEGIAYDLLRNVRATVKAYLKTKRYQ